MRYTKIVKLANIQEEYRLTKTIHICTCEGNQCSGRFLKIKHWQKYCQWECLKLGYATQMNLKYNIFTNMKLTLTIQEVEDENTKEMFKGVFGTLILDSHKEKHADEMLEWAERDKEYTEAVEKDEETTLTEPKKPVLTGINFAVNSKSIPGLDEIINDIISDAVNLDKRDSFKKMRESAKAQNSEEEEKTTQDEGILYEKTI